MNARALLTAVVLAGLSLALASCGGTSDDESETDSASITATGTGGDTTAGTGGGGGTTPDGGASASDGSDGGNNVNTDTGTPNPDGGGGTDPEPDTGLETQGGSLTLDIDHSFGGDSVTLNTSYETAGGDPYEISTIRYWLTNVSLTDASGGNWEVPESYYLVEQTQFNTRLSITMTDIPGGDYTQLDFSIGVDSLHNHNLDMFEGELEAGIGMDWSWNSGFIFFKLEGQYLNNDTGALKSYTAHCGGDELLQAVTIDLGEALRIDGTHSAAVTLGAAMDSIPAGYDWNESDDNVGGPIGSPCDTLSQLVAGWFTLDSAASEEL